LFAAAGQRLLANTTELDAPLDGSLSVDERIDAVTATRSVVFERTGPFNRAARVVAPTSTALQAWHRTMLERCHDGIARAFSPEISQREPSAREILVAALDLATSWQSWDHLRQGGLSVDSARMVEGATLRALLSSRSLAS
jgi:hypothetical protein